MSSTLSIETVVFVFFINACSVLVNDLMENVPFKA